MFRYDRPQAGRFREFYQVGAELFGELDPTTDAQMIAVMMKFYEKLGLKDLVVKVNSIGDAKSRVKINKALVDFLSGHRRQLCNDCKNRMVKNPLRALDCKERGCQAIMEEAGSVLLDHLTPDSRNFFHKVLEYLDDMGVNYELTPRLVRGLDYYSHTVFEVVSKNDSNSLGGGGRYDGLMKLLGGPDTPAIGFALGVERTIDLMKQQEVAVPEPVMSDIFVAQLGDEAKKKAIKVITQVQDAGFRVAHALGRESIKSQLRVADRLKTKLAIIVGEQEVHDGSVIIRDLGDGTQEAVIDRDLLKAIQRKLKERK
jgi:histidyl-tRNA synthetase